MTHNEQLAANDPSDAAPARDVRRRRFLTLGAGVGATLLARCATETELGDGGDGSTPTDGDEDATSSATAKGETEASGAFRLLVSDRPAAIDDFDELNVSFDRARIFRAGDGGEEDATEAGTATATSAEPMTETDGEADVETEPANETDADTEAATVAASEPATEAEDGEGSENGEGDDGEERGFFVADLGGATVDLTQVVGEKAVSVFDGALSEGRYAKIELRAADIEGIVDGEVADVKIPSGKLQIVKPFEVVAGETLSFVFDINVVEKGRTGRYNLLPVISESGVGGKDVEVEEVGPADSGANGSDEGEADAEETGENGTDEEEAESAADDSDAGTGEGQGPPDGTETDA